MNKLPHQQCYCQSSLTKYKRPNGDWECYNCCKSIPNTDQILYACTNSQCFYKETSTQRYIVCTECHDGRNGDGDTKHDQEEKADFIYSKFKASTDIIS